MGICPRCGSWVDDGDVCRSCGGVREAENNQRRDNYESTGMRLVRMAKEYSDEGNHLKAIELYEKANSGRDNYLLFDIAKEYELMGDYNKALDTLSKAYSFRPNDLRVILGKADLLYYFNRYDEAIDLYKKAIGLYNELILNEEGKITPRFVSRSKVNKVISDIYVILGNESLAEKYKKEAENDIDNYVEKELNRFNESFNKGNYFSAKFHYENVLEYRPDAIPKDQLEECKRVFNLTDEEQRKYSEQKKKELQEKEEKRKRKEEKRKREEQRRKYEEQRRRREAEEKRRKKECMKNPKCIKKEIKNQKKVFKHSPLIFRSDSLQKDGDDTFREILELEQLLENMGIKDDLTKDDIELLKKENKHLKYCINHFNYEYRANALKLFVKNYKKLIELKDDHREKSFVKSILDDVFNSDSKDFEAFDVEVDARNRLRLANIFFNNFTKSNKATDLQDAYDLVNEGNEGILNYLNNKNSDKYPSLIHLNNEIKELLVIIEKAIVSFIKNHKNSLFLINMDKRFYIEHGSNLKLLKKNNEDIPKVYYENKAIASIYDSQASDFEKLFSSTNNLKNLPKLSQAKYFFRYKNFDIIMVCLLNQRK